MSFFRVEAEPLLAMDRMDVFAEGLDHPEGLAFDRDGVLWAGGEAGQIYRITPDARVTQVATTGGFCLGLTFSAREELFICDLGKHAIHRMDRSGRMLHSISEAAGHKLVTPNFSLFHPDGSMYFSDSGHWGHTDGNIFRVRENGATELFAGPLAFPNGMALSADGNFLFAVETTRDRVLRIPILENGNAGDAEVYADGLERVPDGLALDVAGNLYVTCYATDCIYQVAPSRQVSLFLFDPAGTMLSRPTNVAFGGTRGQEMYIANLGRWHISRIELPTAGLTLANQAEKGIL